MRAEPEPLWGEGISSAGGEPCCVPMNVPCRRLRCGSWVLLVRLSWVLLEEILWYGFILKNVFSDCNRNKVPAVFLHSHSFCWIMSKYPTADPRQSFWLHPNSKCCYRPVPYQQQQQGQQSKMIDLLTLECSWSIFKRPVNVQIKVAGRACLLYRFCTLKWFSSPRNSGH